jgi:hypothetical protein
MEQWMPSALVGGEWSASHPGRFNIGDICPWYPLDRRLVVPRAGLDDVEKNKFFILPRLKL